MVPQATRRAYLGSLSLTALGALAGCTESLSDGDDSTTTTRSTETQTTEESTTEQTTTESESDPPTAKSPKAAVRAFVTTSTEQPVAVRAYFHPIHPFSAENLTAEDAEQLFGQSGPPEDYSLTAERRELDAAAVLEQSMLQATDLAVEDVAAAIKGEETAVVNTTTTSADGETEQNKIVTVTHDGGWVILAQSFHPEGGLDGDSPFEVRVVDAVSFDTEADTARVDFVESSVADEVTVSAEVAYSERSTTTPEAVEYFSLPVDPGGDTLVVTATTDGETREVHREQYPPDERVVADVMFEENPEDDDREAIARVSFADGWESDELAVAATVSGYEASFEPGGSADYATAGIDPAGDEVVVSRTDDGESTVVHRERYHP